MNNSSITYHSHHYFIGKRLKKIDALKIKESQSLIQQKNLFIEPNEIINNIYTPFIYLGYFSEDVEQRLKNLLLPELFAVGEKFGPMKCPIRNFSFTGQARKFKYLGLTYESPNNYLENIIIPYLKSYTDTFTGLNLSYENIPMIPLFRLNYQKQSLFLKENQHVRDSHNKYIFTNLPTPQLRRDEGSRFIEIDSLDLLRATPSTIKKGRKSFNEDLIIDTIISIPFDGNLT